MKKYATYPYIGNSGYTHEIKTLPEVIDFDRPWLISDAQVLLPKKPSLFSKLKFKITLNFYLHQLGKNSEFT